MNQYRIRAFILFCLLFLGFVSIIGRGVYLQLRPDPKLIEFSEGKSKWLESKSQASLIKSRGSILDREGREMALSLISKSFFANPRLIQKPESVAYKLASHLKIDKSRLASQLNQDRFFVWLKREVDEVTARKIEDLEIPGIHYQKESKRVYPQGELGRSVLGFSGRDGRGLEGIEKNYDSWLVVSDEAKGSGIRDALGRTLLFEDFERQWFEGHDVVLTLDLRLQRIVEQELKSVVEKEKALTGQAVMMDPQTGAILAMASIDRQKAEFFRNRTVSDAYEPGSTFKLVTAMAAIEKLHYKADSQIFAENGLLRIGPNRVSEYNRKKFGWISLAEMLMVSSNIAASKLALKMESQNLNEVIQRFGFGENTGIDLPGEAKGILRSASSWKPIDLANISFGQGLSASPLQMTRAYAVIANGGYLVQPHVVKQVQTSESQPQVLWKPELQKKEVFNAAQVRELRRMLVQVTEEGGTGMGAAVKGFEVAGKTGTAQKLVEEEMASGRTRKVYSSSKSMVSFIGFVPAEAPAFVLYVMYDEPENRSSGGSVAAPSFGRIASKSLGLLGVRPVKKEVVRSKNAVVADSVFVGKSFEEVLKEIRNWDTEKQEQVQLIGFGSAVREELDEKGVRIYFE